MNVVQHVEGNDRARAGRGLFAKVTLQLLRVVLVGIVIAAAVIVGLLLPHFLRDELARVPQVGALAFGTATFVAVARDLIKSLPFAITYVANASVDLLAKLFAEIAVAALGLGVAWYSSAAAVTTIVPPLPRETTALNLSVGSSLPPIILNEGGSVFTTYLVFGEFEDELKASDPQFELVTGLISTLKDCIQSPTDQVSLLVRAYASSSGSDTQNTQLFRQRGAYTATLLRETLDRVAPDEKGQFRIETRNWPTLEVMEARRLFKDTGAQGEYLQEAANLNRRSEILVRSAGACLSE